MIKLCCNCTHFNPDSNGCRRLIIVTGLDLVWGLPVYRTTKELPAYRERRAWFGCGTAGRYWVRDPQPRPRQENDGN